MRLAILAAALLVCGCAEKEKTADAIDVADTNARNALGRIEELSSRLDQLEQENDDLESRLNEVEDQNVKDARALAESAEFDQQVQEKFNEHTHTRYAHKF